MRYQIDTQELRAALAALLSLTKKMPPDTESGGASISLMRDRQGDYRLMATQTWYHASVSLPGLECLTASRNDELEPWDDNPKASAWGFADPQAILSVVSKLPKKSSVTLTRKRDASKITMECGSSRVYEFMLGDPSGSTQGYGMHDDGTVVCEFDASGLEAFCVQASAMSSIITKSATRPEFESLCLSAEEVEGKDGRFLRISANARDDGLSLVDTREDSCPEDFTALVPRETAGGLQGFIKQMPATTSGKLVSFPVAPGQRKAKGISVRGDGYELYLTCRTDEFPFASIDQILDTVSSPSVRVREPSKPLRDALGRTQALAKPGLAAVSFYVTDAGALTLEQHDGLLPKTIVARETLDAVEPERFPDDEATVYTNVNANTMSKAIMKFVDSKDVAVCIVGTSGQGILSVHGGETVYDGLCIVTAALRI